MLHAPSILQCKRAVAAERERTPDLAS